MSLLVTASCENESDTMHLLPRFMGAAFSKIKLFKIISWKMNILANYIYRVKNIRGEF